LEDYVDTQTFQMLEALLEHATSQILRRLSKAPATGGEISTDLELSETTVNHYLEVLALCGVVSWERFQGKRGRPGKRWSLVAGKELEALGEHLRRFRQTLQDPESV